MGNKKGLTPLLATGLLVGISVALGAIVMTWGETYVEERASFAIGAEEVAPGCDIASISVPFVLGKPDVCASGGKLIFSMDNGPNTEIFDLKARLLGTRGVANYENLLKTPLPPGNGIKISVSYELGIGEPVQLKLTPKVGPIERIVECPRRAVSVEPIPPCG